MTIDTKHLISITDANRNFSRVARMVDQNGLAVVLKNNVPRYLIVEFSLAEKEGSPQESVEQIAHRLLEQIR